MEDEDLDEYLEDPADIGALDPADLPLLALQLPALVHHHQLTPAGGEVRKLASRLSLLSTS